MLTRPEPTQTTPHEAIAASLLEQIRERDQALSQRDAQILDQQQALQARADALAATNAELTQRLAELKTAATLIEKLKFELARYQRIRYGRKSEALGAEQIALWEAELDADIEALQVRLDSIGDQFGAKKPPQKGQARRQALPESLPRVLVSLEPESTTCGCGVPMVRIGEDTAETLQMIPSRFWVKRTVRGKWACRCCETVQMAPLPATAIEKSIAGTSVIANVIVSKYEDHQPLHRQEGIYARMGVAIPRSTMAGWIGRVGVSAEPLTDLLAQHIVGHSALQADETPVSVLDPGTGKTATGYVWAYRTLPSDPVQAVTFDFAMSRAQQHANRMLANFQGTLQVDGYAGYNQILARPGVIEAGCWAHARRKFVEVYETTQSPVAQQAITRIAALYAIEREIGTPEEVTILDRERHRKARAGPLLEAFRDWLLASHGKAPARSALAQAMKYTLNRWPALTRYVEDGRLPLDTNAVENSIRPLALGRRNWMFAGSPAGGKRAAQMYSLIASAKMNGHEPLAYLADIIERLPTARQRDLEAMLPWNWKPPADPIDIAAELRSIPEPLRLIAG